MRWTVPLLAAALLCPLSCAYVPSQSEMADYDECQEHQRDPCHDPSDRDTVDYDQTAADDEDTADEDDSL
jgi:hypothetical protein